MVRIPSVSSDKNRVNECAAFITRYLRKKRLHVAMERTNGYTVVFASNTGSRQCDILFNAHIDVVPGERTQFAVRETRGKLTGRGVLDCKGHVAVVMNLLARARASVSVGAIFTCDEEIGGLTTKYMVGKGYGGKLVIVLDGNMDRVTIAQKGILSLKLIARGMACHSSAPWRGQNAIDNLITGYLKVKKLFPMVNEKRSWRNTLAATIVSGGSVANQVPDRAEMVLNARFTEKTRPQELLRKIRAVSGLRVQRIMVSPFFYVQENNPLVRHFLSSMKQRLNPGIRIGRMNGATDARHFSGAAKAIVITGLKGGGAHSDHEWLLIRSVDRLENALYEFITSDWNNRP